MCSVRRFVMGVAAVLQAVSASGDDIRTILDVPYGSDPLQQVDIYLPAKVEQALPAVVWIHGGGWREGDKREGVNRIGEFAPFLVEHGYVAVACNYRLVPKDLHPAQVDDVQRMIRWLRFHAADYHIDPDRIGVVGISAGGHLAAMLAVKTGHAKQGDELDEVSSRVQAAVSLAGVHDFTKSPELMTPELEDGLLKAAAGDVGKVDQLRKDLSPIRYVTKDAAPLMLVIGTKDPWLPVRQAQVMGEALEKQGVATEVVLIEGAGHGIFPREVLAARDTSLRWLDRFLREER